MSSGSGARAPGVFRTYIIILEHFSAFPREEEAGKLPAMRMATDIEARKRRITAPWGTLEDIDYGRHVFSERIGIAEIATVAAVRSRVKIIP